MSVKLNHSYCTQIHRKCWLVAYVRVQVMTIAAHFRFRTIEVWWLRVSGKLHTQMKLYILVCVESNKDTIRLFKSIALNSTWWCDVQFYSFECRKSTTVSIFVVAIIAFLSSLFYFWSHRLCCLLLFESYFAYVCANISVSCKNYVESAPFTFCLHKGWRQKAHETRISTVAQLTEEDGQTDGWHVVINV